MTGTDEAKATFAEIADSIRSKTGKTATMKITDMASEIDRIVLGITPSGTKSISSNGTYDVTSYASAKVSVPGITPSGTKSITSNGTYDITNYAKVSVNCPTASPVTEVSGTPNTRYIRSGIANPSAISMTIKWNANSSVIGSKSGTLHVAWKYNYSSSWTYTSDGSLLLSNSQLLSGMIWVALGQSGTVYTGTFDSDLYDSTSTDMSKVTVTASITV